jgi:hypothetical protein
MGVRTGMCFSLISLACLTGPPLAGALTQIYGGHCLYVQLFGGSAFMGVTCTSIVAQIAKIGFAVTETYAFTHVVFSEQRRLSVIDYS